MDKKIKVIIVDDDYKFAESLKTSLETFSSKIAVILTLPNCNDIIRKTKEIKPDLIFMDINFENEKTNGIDEVKKIRKDYSDSQLKIIMLTESSNIQDVKRAISAGASGYIQKHNKDYSWIHYVIEIVEENIIKIADPKIINHILLSLRETNSFKLNPRDVLLLQYSANGLSAKEIADIKDSKGNQLTLYTVTTFLRDIREVLDAKNIAHAVAIAFRNNLIQ